MSLTCWRVLCIECIVTVSSNCCVLCMDRARKRAQMTVAPAKPTQKFLDMQKAAHQKIADDRDKALKKYQFDVQSIGFYVLEY